MKNYKFKIKAFSGSELFFSISCGVFLLTAFVLGILQHASFKLILPLYLVSYFFGGYYTFLTTLREIRKGKLEIDFLMLLAALGAAIIGEWLEGALLLFLFSLGHSLEHFAMNRAHKSIASLQGLAPKVALLKTTEGAVEVLIEALKIDDIVVVKPNAKIPADGFIVKGEGTVNQAPITGESVPVEKSFFDNTKNDLSFLEEENKVWAGTINGNHLLEIKVLKLAKDSTLARLIKIVNEAQSQKSPTQLFAEKFEKYYVPIVLLLVFVLNFAFLVVAETFNESFYRAMAVLVGASPCALAISTPSAVLSAIGRAARQGILIKGGRPLEHLGNVKAVAFDKTGTLTEGKPQLTHVISLNNYDNCTLLEILIAIEKLSDHPLAKAIVVGARQRLKKEGSLVAENSASVLGKGLKATVNGKNVAIGNLRLFEDLDDVKPSSEIRSQIKKLEAEGNTTMLLRSDDNYIGIVALMDTPRKEAKVALEKLREIGVKRMVMLTGDNQNVANAVANEIGLSEAQGSLLPEAKVKAIQDLMQKEKVVAMVGDGVNDAPAMAYSSVAIAMGAASSPVALETADVALLSDDLLNIPFVIALSRKSNRIIKQNVWISLGVVALLVPFTIFGFVNLVVAVVVHEGSTVLVVLNALRLLGFKQK
jgi:Cd2+/Zn2+-exporting ATPase